MQQSDIPGNVCPNCDRTRGRTRKCRGCGFRFDIVGAAGDAPIAEVDPPAPTSRRWRESRSARYMGRVGFVALGMVLGAIAATPSEDKVALATATAGKIEKRAERHLSEARDRADEIVSDAEDDAEEIADESEADRRAAATEIAALRKTTASLTKRRNALSTSVRSLKGQLSSKRSELQSVKTQLSSARSSLASAQPSTEGGSGCHPSYSGACLSQGAGDYDCSGGSGDGPNYTGTVSVVGYDEFDLDRDGDGVACDS